MGCPEDGMIGYLRGILREKTPDSLILDVGGVGYEVSVPASSFCVLPREGQEGCLYIYTHVREDVLKLFGFASLFDRKVFEMLIGVSNVGPRLAIQLLGPMNGTELCHAIQSGNITHLVNVPGVGPRTAERLVMELKPKVLKLLASRADFGATLAAPAPRQDTLFGDGLLEVAAAADASSDLRSRRARAAEEIRAAIVNLGYKEKQVNEAWKAYENDIGPHAEVIAEDALRAILRRLSGHAQL